MRRAYRQSGWLWAGALALWLGACSSSDEAGSDRGGWWNGGQTGSLEPLCGLTPGALQRGVPASAAGILVDAAACGDGRLLEPLTVRDASGRPIAFSVERLPDGELLIVPAGGLMPGSYTVSVTPDGDEDGGVADPPALIEQTVNVQQEVPLPDAFGLVERSADRCDTVIQLSPYAETLPYLGLISVDFQIDGGAVMPLIRTGTMKLDGSAARVAVPMSAVEWLTDGEHQLLITVRIAGESMPLDVFMMTLEVPCDSTAYVGAEDAGGICSAASVRSARLSTGAVAVVLAAGLFAMRKRRRRAR